jgi:hypothetical protein
VKWNIIVFVTDIPDWPEADLMELMKRMEKEIPQKDSLRFDSRADKLNWDNVRQFFNMLILQVQDVCELGTRGTELGLTSRPYTFHQVLVCIERLAEIYISVIIKFVGGTLYPSQNMTV